MPLKANGRSPPIPAQVLESAQIDPKQVLVLDDHILNWRVTLSGQPAGAQSRPASRRMRDVAWEHQFLTRLPSTGFPAPAQLTRLQAGAGCPPARRWTLARRWVRTAGDRSTPQRVTALVAGYGSARKLPEFTARALAAYLKARGPLRIAGARRELARSIAQLSSSAFAASLRSRVKPRRFSVLCWRFSGMSHRDSDKRVVTAGPWCPTSRRL